jgi:hypothetical protein
MTMTTSACGAHPPHCDDCGGPMTDPTPIHPNPPAETAQLADIDVDELLDIDQPREQKPDGDWTEQVYVGPKQYDKLFVELTHDAPPDMSDHPSGPLAAVDHVDLYTGTSTTPAVTIKQVVYHAETVDGFEYDGRGPTMDTRETLRINLGATIGDYIKNAHPFTVILRARTAAGALVYEHTFDGDEAGDYPTIVPPRPY